MGAMRVLVADDHALFRRGLQMVLEAEPDIELIGEASDGVEAVERSQELMPDVEATEDLDAVGGGEMLADQDVEPAPQHRGTPHVVEPRGWRLAPRDGEQSEARGVDRDVRRKDVRQEQVGDPRGLI